MRRVVHVITGLKMGGAERQLERVVTSVVGSHLVICLGNQGVIGERLTKSGISVVSLGIKSPASWLGAGLHLRHYIREFGSEVVQGWMYHGNLAAVAGTLGSGLPIFWNVRHSLNDLSHELPRTRAAIRASVYVSGCPQRIIYNSEKAAKQHEILGYPSEATRVIPNGFDTAMLCGDTKRRQLMRQELAIPLEAPLVGMAARYHPMKNHSGFLRMAAIVAKRMPDTYFVVAGRGVNRENRELASLIDDPALQGKVRILGECQDMVDLYSALDLLCCPSTWGEAFPNVVGEAMSCGVPCVVTDLGDSATIVGPSGVTIRPGDERGMAQAVGDLLQDPERRKDLGSAARSRIKASYGIDTVASAYSRLWQDES